MKIALVIGHDANRKGAYGNKGISEWDFNDQLIQEMNLSDKHTYYVLYRNADIKKYSMQMIELHERIDKLGCELAIEFHFNATIDSNVHGNEVLYCSSIGMKYAKILDECLDILPNRDRGIKKVAKNERGGGFLCRGKSICLIAEPFFAERQHLYVWGGEHRQLLKDAYKKFFKSI